MRSSNPGSVSSFNRDTQPVRSTRSVYIIGVCGGSGSGKSTICRSLIKLLPSTIRTQILSMDCFYRPLNAGKLLQASRSEYDFDHPSALDIDRFESVVQSVKQGQRISIKDYDFVTHTLTVNNKHHFDGSTTDVLFVEGIHVFQRPDLFNLKIFVDVDSDERLARRILRDTEQRGRTFQDSIAEWRNFVKPNYDCIISNTKRFADVIIPRGGGNKLAFDMISAHISEHLSKQNTGNATDSEE